LRNSIFTHTGGGGASPKDDEDGREKKIKRIIIIIHVKARKYYNQAISRHIQMNFLI
jgi:hypothetical protein